MIYNIDNMDAFKCDMLGGLHRWLDAMVDELCDGTRMPLSLSPYLKRGVNNALRRYDSKLQSYMDTAAMFLADADGNIDSGNFISDAVSVFRSMPKRGSEIGGVRITYGEGCIEAQLPDNWLTRLLGDVGTIRITAEDIDRLASELIA